MIWMSWRQFRAQALVGVLAVAVLATWTTILGRRIHHTYTEIMTACHLTGDCEGQLTHFLDQFRTQLYFLDALVIAIPALLGVFWGAPLIAREFETGTHQLVWNQSVPRRRWLAGRLLVTGAGTAVIAGVCSFLVTRAASEYDAVAAGPIDPLGLGRFSGLLFGARNLTPVAYGVFAFALGAILGTLIRRTLPAMALTLALFVVIQVLVPTLVRPHLMTPVTQSKAMNAEALEHLARLGSLGGGATVGGLKIPGAWVTSTSELLTAEGRPLEVSRFKACLSGNPGDAGLGGGDAFARSARCLGRLDLHIRVSYQPLSRYWRFQWSESAIFGAATVLLAGLGLWVIRRTPV